MTTPDVPAANEPVRFGDFVLDIANAQLIRQGQPVELPPKSFALLAYLAQRPGELVLKDTLLDAVWGRRFVSEGAIKTVVSELRAALGDDARAPLWIETVQRRGYRFVGRLQPIAVSAARTGAAPEASPCGNLPAEPDPCDRA
ncbi:MAG: transcriptional regulator [Betaproteobacteria bacterium]|nr:transcriptional regulator [Betaproteobacteria bacterium]